jgi:NADP-dependent 3-hydroxy acid dehydrogenase YdfG
MKLNDKVAIVTGASSGIGKATALLLASEGAKVVLAARRLERLEQLKNDIIKTGGEAIAIKTDVVQRSEVESMVKAAIDQFGKVDILINNSGIMPLSFMKNLHVEEWERMVDVNLKGALYCIAAVLPDMMKNKSGDIINVSSVAGRKLFPSGAVYCATKFGLTALSEGMRMELSKDYNIRVTAIEPGAVATELTHTITDKEVLSLWSGENMAKLIPLKSEDIARSVLYAVTQPEGVSVNEVLIIPTSQGI